MHVPEGHQELVEGVAVHLQRELDSEYASGISRRGQRLSASSVETAHWAGDEIEVQLIEKGRKYRVRMVLPLFEDHGYTLTVCSCMEERYLEDQRCHHMWFAQHYVLEELRKSQVSSGDDRPLWVRLKDISCSNHWSGAYDSGRGEGDLTATTKGPELVWFLSSGFSLSPALWQNGALKVLSWKRFLGEQFFWAGRADGATIAAHLFSARMQGGDVQGFRYELLDLLCGLGSSVVFEGDSRSWRLSKSGLKLSVGLVSGGLRVYPCIPGCDSMDFIRLDGPQTGGLLLADRGQRIFYLTDPGDPLVALLDCVESTDQGFLPEQMRREYCEALSSYDYARMAVYRWKESDLEGPPALAPDHQRNFYFRLTPIEPEGVYVEFLLRPLSAPDYKRFYVRPGSGQAVIYDYSSFPPGLIRRDIRGELHDSCSLLSGLNVGKELIRHQFELKLSSDYEALQLLNELEGYAGKDRIYIEWPDGLGRPAKYRPVEEAPGETLRVELTKKSVDWFDLRGGLWLDGRQIDLKSLVTAYQKKQRFIKLDHDRWFQISERLAARIQWLCENFHPASVSSSSGEFSTHVGCAGLSQAIEGIEISGDQAFRKLKERISEAASGRAELPSIFKGTLRSYQKAGFQWLYGLSLWGTGAVLADDMGLGKTVQAVSFLCARVSAGPVLILCPSSLCDNWFSEIRKFSEKTRPLLIRDCDEVRLSEETEWMQQPGLILIGSYGLLMHGRGSLLEKIAWGTLILDEAQVLKNRNSKTFRQVCALSAGFILALSGTPLENNLTELWSLFRLVCPGLFGSYEAFAQKWISGDEAATASSEGIRRLIRPFILRRTKEAYLKELPPKTIKPLNIYMSPEERKLYDEYRMRALADLKAADPDEGEQKRKIRILAWLTRLRQIAVHPKLVEPDWPSPSVREAEFLRMAKELVQARKRALVFSQFPSFLELLKEGAGQQGYRCLLLRGSTPVEERKHLVQTFQEGDIDFFMISLKAGGTGLNLTRAEVVIILDPWWNPAAEAQAMDRACRIGQKNPVTVYKFISQKTIEEKIIGLQDAKKDLSQKILSDCSIPASMDLTFLESIIA